MKTIKISMLLLLALTIGCSDDENPLPLDPRENFVGEYETEDYDLNIYINFNPPLDTMFAANGGIDIKIERNDDEPDEIVFEGLDEFILDGIQQIGLTSPQTTLTADEEVIGVVDGDDFELESTDFTLTSTDSYPFTLEGEGSIEGNVLIMEFEYTSPSSGYTLDFSGEVEMEKQEE